MATPNVGILTNAGKNLIDQVNAGQTKITFSKIVFSSMNNNQLTDEQIKALTTVAPQEIVVNNPEVTLDNNTGETRIRATGNNETLTDGVYVKTYAVFAKDDSGNEILYGITVSPNPNYLPEYDGVTPQAVTYSYKVNISNTSNITFTNSNDVYVSDTDLAEELQPYAKTIDVNQQLDKKVNVTDMRKPASDVVGLEDVPTAINRGEIATGTDLATITQEGIYVLGGHSFIHFVDTDVHWGTLTVTNQDGMTTQLAKCTSSIGDQIFFRTKSGTSAIWHPWTMVPRFSTDNSLVLPNGEQLNPADDSKVAHLSGANNFDTTPTVNHNPLLLASSLPSDLARTGSDQEFTGKNTFDTAPIDKITGKPYITKDGVPSDVARTSQDTNFTGKLQKGGIDVATAADLKSVEADAWHVAESNYPGLLMQVNRDEKIIYILSTGNPTTTRIIDRLDDEGASNIICDLSSYIDKIVSASGYVSIASNYGSEIHLWTLDFTGAKLLYKASNNTLNGKGGYTILGDPKVLNNTSPFLKLQYNSWIGE